MQRPFNLCYSAYMLQKKWQFHFWFEFFECLIFQQLKMIRYGRVEKIFNENEFLFQGVNISASTLDPHREQTKMEEGSEAMLTPPIIVT